MSVDSDRQFISCDQVPKPDHDIPNVWFQVMFEAPSPDANDPALLTVSNLETASAADVSEKYYAILLQAQIQ